MLHYYPQLSIIDKDESIGDRKLFETIIGYYFVRNITKKSYKHKEKYFTSNGDAFMEFNYTENSIIGLKQQLLQSSKYNEFDKKSLSLKIDTNIIERFTNFLEHFLCERDLSQKDIL